ncbi:MAG: hypothetical protein CMJ48_02635 [Planctomycetaceae bacterium]|nr:hypothetical protein [Planctomycetaceae bacterium]
MNFAVTILFYLLVGLGVGVAVLLRDRQSALPERSFQTVAAVLFWPLFVPVLLQRVSGHWESSVASRSPTNTSPTSDRMSVAITQVEAELDAALKSLNGWSETILAGEHDRFAELRNAWRAQAERIRELDTLFESGRFGEGDVVDEETVDADDRFEQSTRARRDNVRRLRQVRERMHRDLMGTLAWVRELATMIHLARYTGAPASRAEELVTQIAAAVEGLSEVTTWNEDVQTSGSRETFAV